MARDSSGSEIAVVGYGVRASGVNGPEEFWQTLVEERCLIREIPATRWSETRFTHPDPDAPGTTYVNRAGIVEDLFEFDAGYFGISPREAAQIDPQQRMLLEVTSEALEHAGILPASLAGPGTGIFIGASSLDHGGRFASEMSRIDSAFMLGNTLSIHSNRLAYFLDAQGPSYTVDTACSSSAFALHQACEALKRGEIDTAIVGGVNALLSPLPFVGFARASMLSPDGLCKAFDAGANGYVRAEGAVIFVLKRAAETGNLRTRSIILGTGINTDGRTAGMSMPSVTGQSTLMRRISTELHIDVNDLAFVEAHGTGTPVGDPVEAQAIGEIYGMCRGTPLPIGSAKTNFGHLEPASGLIGLLKAQLALENNFLPASLHFDTPNPHIDFDALNLSIANSAQPLEDRQRPWLAAVNSFGFGGANAHAILRQPWAHENPVSSDLPPATSSLTLSAATADSLKRLAQDWAKNLADASPTDAAIEINNANHHRARHPYRAVITGNSSPEILQTVANFAQGKPDPFVLEGKAYKDGKVGFVFSGNGAQWAGMGRHLFDTDKVFRHAFEEVSDLAAAWGGPALCDLMLSPDLEAELKRSTNCQPLNFALQVALVEALRHAGLHPAAAVGHSAGEVAAAWCSGALTLADAVHLICPRAVTMEVIRGTGSMAALLCDRAQGEKLLPGLALCISAENSPRSLTVSGPMEDLKILIVRARKSRVAAKMLDIEYPYHSEEVERIETRLRADLQRIKPRLSGIAYFSSTTGNVIETTGLDAEYWWQNARQPVLFRQSIENMVNSGIQVLLEVGARTVLKTYIADTVEAMGSNAVHVRTLDPGTREELSARQIVAEAVANGALPDGQQFWGIPVPFKGMLPRYPWAHETHIVTRSDDAIDLFGEGREDHPLLGARLRKGEGCWHSTIDPRRLKWLADHKVDGVAVLPATCFLDIMAAAGAEMWQNRIEVTDIDILHAVTFDDKNSVELRTSYDGSSGAIRIESRRAGTTQDWTLSATGTLRQAPGTEPDLWNGKYDQSIETDYLYSLLSDRFLEYGPSFRLSNSIRLGKGVAETSLSLPPPAPHCINPMSADAAFHVFFPLIDAGSPDPLKQGETILPIRIERARILQPGAECSAARLRLQSVSKLEAVGDIQISDLQGNIVAEILGLRLKKVSLKRAGMGFPGWITHRVKLRNNTPVALPAIWLDPLSRLSDLGLLDDERNTASGLSDTALLIDAAVRRIVWQQFSAGPQVHPETDVARSCLEALAADDMAIPGPDGYQISKSCIYPDLPNLLEELARISPDTAPELKTLLQIETALTDFVAGNPTQPALLASTKFDAELWSVAGLILDDLKQHWRPPERLVIGLAGTPPRALMQRLLEYSDGVVLCGGHYADDHPRLQRGDGHTIDLLVQVNHGLTLSKIDLAPGGLRICLSPGADLFETLRALLLKLSTPLPRVGTRVALKSGEALVACTISDTVSVDAPGIPPVHVIGSLEGITSAGPEVDDWLIVAEKSVENGSGINRLIARIECLKATVAKSPERLWILNSRDTDTALSAFANVLKNEGLDVRVIHRSDADISQTLADAMAAPANEVEYFRADNGAVTAQRIEPFVPAPMVEGDAWQLSQIHNNDPDTLYWQTMRRRTPDAGEVEVEVAASGLNFRDVLWAQGLLPEEALADGFTGPSLGMEFAGIVKRSAVQELPKGTAVMGFAPSAFSSHLTIPATTLCAVPDGISTDVAASIPTIFVTALYALADLARLKTGETVLIHGAAGGVGLAAMQIAKQIGARIFATAGTPEKRRLLETLGAEAVFDSRLMEFADQIRDLGGVDVVLNSLFGEAMERSINCLKPFGRFVELGKRDFYANNRIGLRPFRRNLSYLALDADQLFCARPDLLQDLLARLGQGFASGDFKIPACQIFNAEDAVDAFRLMQRSGHIGKILIRPPATAPVPISKHDYSGTWLITGGLGGFGLETAIWLASQGADRLVLTGRRGKIDEADRGRFEATGAELMVVAADTCDHTAMKRLLKTIGPLTGIVHAAMVLDDALFTDTTPEQIETVLRPKVLGLEVLEVLTTACPPRYFICYSSIATLIGNPGQSVYVAANAYMEGRMRARSAKGLHGLAVGWGPIADAGVLARDEAQREMIAKKLGAPLVQSKDALAALDRFLTADEPVVYYGAMNWGKLAGDLTLLRTNLTSRLDLANERAQGAISLADLIEGLKPNTALRKVTEILTAETSAILRMQPSEIDPLRPLADLGFDSLMALNLRMVAEEKYGIQLPLIALMDGTTLAQAAAGLLKSINNEAGPDTDVVTSLASAHSEAPEISDETRQELYRKTAALTRLSS